MNSFQLDTAVDVVIVGTGAGGGPVAARLAAAGMSVVVLEAGGWRPSRSHMADERAAEPLYWLEERLSSGDMPVAFGANNSGTGVGGSLLHWGAFCPRPDARDMALHRTSGQGADWPIPHDTLVPYLQAVERQIGVSGPTPYPWDADRHYALPPLPHNAPAALFLQAAADCGIRASDAPAAVLSVAAAEGRPACANCGTCHQGCRNGAKFSPDLLFIPQAIASGAELRTHMRVVGMEQDPKTGRVTAVQYRDQTGASFRQACKALFLCAGGIETPRLLLHCGLANSSGMVGRNFMAHVATQIWGQFEQEIRGNHGYPSGAISEDMVRPDGADFAGGYLMQSLGVLPITLGMAMARSQGLWGRDLLDFVKSYRHQAGIGINGECLPHPDNRLTLSDEQDDFGVPKAHVSFSYHDNERRLDQHAQATMRAIWERAGARDIRVISRTAHTIGTCRMGVSPEDSVVNPDGCSHDIGNLYVCDNSIFPSALAANPALTIMALSLRMADRYVAAV